MSDTSLVDNLINQSLNPPAQAPIGRPYVEPVLARGQASQPRQVVQPQRFSTPSPQQVVQQPSHSQLAQATNSSSHQQEQVYMDSSYGWTSPWEVAESAKKIPTYRLATSCANCAFSTYDPIQKEAFCQRWKANVVGFYYCDSHLDPNSLVPEGEKVEGAAQVYADPNVLPIDEETVIEPTVLPSAPTLPATPIVSTSHYADPQLFAEASAVTPNFDLPAVSKAYTDKKYLQLFIQKYGREEGAFNS